MFHSFRDTPESLAHLARMIQKDHHHSGQKTQVVRRLMGREHQSQTSQTPSTLLSNQNPMSRIRQIAEYCCCSGCRSQTLQHSVVAVQNQYFVVAVVGQTRRMQIRQYFAGRKAWTAHQTSRPNMYLSWNKSNGLGFLSCESDFLTPGM